MATAADLLFRISGDSTPAQEDLEAFRAAVANATGDAGAQLEEMAGRTETSTRGAREAIRGLGEEIGVHMPRFVSSWLASLGPVSGVMSAAFAPIAVIGLVEVLGKIPGALEKGIDWLHGWNEAAKEAFEESTHRATEWAVEQVDIHERLRAIQLIGVEGLQKYDLQARITAQNIAEVYSAMLSLGAEAAVANAALNAPPDPRSSFLARAWHWIGLGNEQIDKAKDVIKDVEPQMKKLLDDLTELQIKAAEIPKERAAEARKETERSLEDFHELSDLLAEVQGKLEKATFGTAADDIAAPMNRLADATQRAIERLGELNAKGHVSSEVFDSQAAAAEKLGPLLLQLQNQLYAEADKKRAEEAAQAEAAMTKGLEAWLQSARQAVQRGLAAVFASEEQAQREEQEYQGELARLGEQRERIEREYQLSEDRIKGQYAADVAKFDAAEEAKTAATATNEAQRAALVAQFAGIRAALLAKEQVDLQALANSQGWKSVFSNEFASMIRGNEALSREWGSSTNQSLMMVRVSLEGMKEMAERAFESMAQGMAANILHAVEYKKSIGAAMEEAARSTVDSLAAQAVGYAIYSAALGLTDLALGNEDGAADAFAAAVLWGEVGGAATAAALAMGAGSQGGAGGSSAPASRSSASSSSSASASDYRSGGGQQNPNVVVNVQGHLVGWTNVSELTAAINDAVLNKDVQLTATNTTTGQQVVR
jgi:hypothetical protein